VFTLLALLVLGACETPTGGNDGDGDFVAVTGISGVPANGTAGTPLALTGTVAPDNATNTTIVWSVQAAGTTAADAAIEGATLTAADEGTVIVTATIVGGAAEDTPYIQDFTVTMNPSLSYRAVTGISGVPAQGTAGIPLTLTGTVAPPNATNKTIAWSVQAEGTTAAGAAITAGNTLTATGTGTVIVTAAIANGATEDTPYTQDFTITISPPNPYTMISISGGTVSDSTTGAGNTTNWAAGANTAYTKPYTMAGFSIGETEVTYELWRAVYLWATDDARGGGKYTFSNPGVMGNKYGSSGSPPGATSQHPVTAISWRNAAVWCNAYSEYLGKTPVYYQNGTADFTDTSKVVRAAPASGGAAVGNGPESAVWNPAADGFRLPTEAEWEYAARGGVPSTSAPWTNQFAGTNDPDALDQYAWYGDTASDSPTHPVKTKQPNSAGLYDMGGNVNEFVWDVVEGSGSSIKMGARGGYFHDPADNVKVSYRPISNPALSPTMGAYTGFRVVSQP
jgi:formylglycine-generating enzyme required for sulfatase activity